MADRKARWALWSVGKITKRVIKEMRISECLDVVAICSSSKEKAQDFIDTNGLSDAWAYDDIQDVLAREDVDIVYIASPPQYHKERACLAMDAGKAVLVEKPMTLNAREAADIFACAKKNNVFCAEGVWTNYFPAMIKAKEWIKSGEIGDVVELISTFGIPVTEFVGEGNNDRWGNHISKGGGSLSQFGVYDVNLAQFIFEKEPQEIFGKSERPGGGDNVDLNSCFLLSYDEGKAHAMISCSYMARTMSISRISGTKGEIVLGNPFFAPFHAELYKKVNHMWYNDLVESFDDPYENSGYEGFKYQFDSVSRQLLKGRKESDRVTHKYSLELAVTVERIRKTLGHIE